MNERQLQWRCRRGTHELDRLMMGYLQGRYPQAPEAERMAFERLVEVEDIELLGLFSGRITPRDEETADVVRRILAGAAHQA